MWKMCELNLKYHFWIADHGRGSNKSTFKITLGLFYQKHFYNSQLVFGKDNYFKKRGRTTEEM